MISFHFISLCGTLVLMPLVPDDCLPLPFYIQPRQRVVRLPIRFPCTSLYMSSTVYLSLMIIIGAIRISLLSFLQSDNLFTG